MMTVSRRVLLPFLAPPLAPPVFSVLAPNPVQTVKLCPLFRHRCAYQNSWAWSIPNREESCERKEATLKIAVNVRT
jgi:hypothetical protein